MLGFKKKNKLGQIKSIQRYGIDNRGERQKKRKLQTKLDIIWNTFQNLAGPSHFLKKITSQHQILDLNPKKCITVDLIVVLPTKIFIPIIKDHSRHFSLITLDFTIKNNQFKRLSLSILCREINLSSSTELRAHSQTNPPGLL